MRNQLSFSQETLLKIEPIRSDFQRLMFGDFLFDLFDFSWILILSKLKVCCLYLFSFSNFWAICFHFSRINCFGVMIVEIGSINLSHFYFVADSIIVFESGNKTIDLSLIGFSAMFLMNLNYFDTKSFWECISWPFLERFIVKSVSNNSLTSLRPAKYINETYLT